jgi:membrane-bound serine protease (ClpP class)
MLFLIAGLLVSIAAGSGAGGRGSEQVVVIPIKGTIDPGTKNFVQRSLNEARDRGAAAVILELNTPGGYIYVAQEIQALMDDCPVPVYALVRSKALSAGAYLALAAEGIYMVPGATMGAAEPRLLGAGQADEKTISTWDKDMRAMAERRGRDPLIAAAMVRKEIAVEGVVEKGELLTLTASEAERLGYCEGIVNSRQEMLDALELSGASLVEMSQGFTDRMVSWVTNPIIGTILLIVGIGGLVIEVLTAGFGLAGILSLTAFALYFAGHLAAGLAGYWVIFLFVLGIVLLLVEAFIPGFGVFGIAGLAATLVSIILTAASVKTGLVMLAVALVMSGVLSAVAFRFMSRRGILRHIILADEERAELGYVAAADQKALLGRRGATITPLRPAGAAEIEGKRVDVITEGSFIPEGVTVEVVRVEGARVVVRRVDSGARDGAEKPAVQ